MSGRLARCLSALLEAKTQDEIKFVENEVNLCVSSSSLLLDLLEIIVSESTAFLRKPALIILGRLLKLIRFTDSEVRGIDWKL
jgi:hypothetical protein